MKPASPLYEPMSFVDFGCWVLAVLWGALVGAVLGIAILIFMSGSSFEWSVFQGYMTALVIFSLFLGGEIYILFALEIMSNVRNEKPGYEFLETNWVHRFWLMPSIAVTVVLVLFMLIQCLRFFL